MRNIILLFGLFVMNKLSKVFWKAFAELTTTPIADKNYLLFFHSLLNVQESRKLVYRLQRRKCWICLTNFIFKKTGAATAVSSKLAIFEYNLEYKLHPLWKISKQSFVFLARLFVYLPHIPCKAVCNNCIFNQKIDIWKDFLFRWRWYW